MKYLNAAGTFSAIVKRPNNGWLGESSQKYTPFIRIPLVIDGGEHDGLEIVWQGYLSDAAFDRTVETLAKAFGWDGDLSKLAEDKPVFEGMPCEIVTEMEDYQGEARCRAKWLNPVGGGGGPVMEPEKKLSLVKSLQRRAMGLAAAVAKENGGTSLPSTPRASARPAPAQAPAQDDDIPF